MSLNLDSKPVVYATREEEKEVARKLVNWLNKWPDKPVSIIQYEQLEDDKVCMTISLIQSPAIVSRYITGGHKSEMQFTVIYRIKPGNSMDQRLTADESLDQLGAWVEMQHPDFGDGIQNAKVVINSRSTKFAEYENGDEDHQILMTLTYEVI